MKNGIEEFKRTLPPQVRNVIDKVLEAELQKLDMKKPQGIKVAIRRIIQEEVKAHEA